MNYLADAAVFDIIACDGPYLGARMPKLKE